jgi:hypothetical protein
MKNISIKILRWFGVIIFALVLTAALFLVGIYFLVIDTETEHIIEREYQITENKKIIVDTWDCGATCDNNTALYLIDSSDEIDLKEKQLLSCYGILNIELSDVTETSAKISLINGDTDNIQNCGYYIDDVIEY